MPMNEKSLAVAIAARVEQNRMDAMLDEALGETFPASDPVAIMPVRRMPGEGDAAAREANEKPSVGSAAHHDSRQPAHESGQR